VLSLILNTESLDFVGFISELVEAITVSIVESAVVASASWLASFKNNNLLLTASQQLVASSSEYSMSSYQLLRKDS
jgi:hypothetical protein